AAELAARLFQHAPVGHARGTYRLARAAPEALIEMLHQLLARSDPALREPAHQVDASARRIRLDLELAIGRTRGETQAAMNAGVDVARRGRVLGVEPRDSGGAVGWSLGFDSGMGGGSAHVQTIANARRLSLPTRPHAAG